MTPLLIATTNPTPVILACVGVSALVGVACMLWAFRGRGPERRAAELAAVNAEIEEAIRRKARRTHLYAKRSWIVNKQLAASTAHGWRGAR